MSARARTTAAVAVPLVALATLGGLVAGCGSTATSGVTSTTQSSTTTVTAPAAPSTATVSTAAPPAVAAPTPAKPAGTRTAAPRPTTAPTVRPWVADPEKAGYEFGFVWGAKRSGGAVVLTFDPAGMLTGDRAKAYYDAHPDEERFDYKILNDKSFTETLRVPASATLYGNQVLGPRNGAKNERITLDRLAARASGSDRTKVTVWLKRSNSGTVVYLAEQYLP